MKQTKAIIERAFRQYRPCLAFSGGGDSSVLLDIVASMGFKPPVIYANSQMEYPQNIDYIKGRVAAYGLELHIAKAPVKPLDCWEKTGFPMLGKMSARVWMQRHPRSIYGIKLDVSSCCRTMKIKPARDLAKKLGCNASLTGQRGGQDDQLRGLRAKVDGAISYVKQDNITQINPLTGWPDAMIRRYLAGHEIPPNPLKKAGALTIGCMFCGGGAQFDNSGFRILRKTNHGAWRKMLLEYGFAEIIIAIKYDISRDLARKALDQLGGAANVAQTMPHVFDFLKKTPLKGYSR